MRSVHVSLSVKDRTMRNNYSDRTSKQCLTRGYINELYFGLCSYLIMTFHHLVTRKSNSRKIIYLRQWYLL